MVRIGWSDVDGPFRRVAVQPGGVPHHGRTHPSLVGLGCMVRVVGHPAVSTSLGHWWLGSIVGPRAIVPQEQWVVVVLWFR